ncbi:MAG: primosomal protein N' [Marinilabiliales bacterium]|nr:MAG: primosomal protein N' [Marinilabiliales bacterium]
MDEEHENTYKQYDPAPRYNARDVAVIMGKIHSAKVLLGTATPSVESYFNAQTGKYGYVEMLTRYGNIQLPEIQVADTRKARKKKQMISHFTPFILEEMDRALTADEQVILFQNRRGFAPFLECETCGWIPVCKNCDVSLTYHKKINKLICHYCGYQIKPVQRCGNCNSHDIHTKGFGTEKIEEELKDIFPKARIQRMDLDSTRKKNSYERIIHEFELHKVDILVGTQMVTKGLDFDNVGLVGILNADNMLHFPDFRAHERSYQLMSQVSGRAGRKKKQGRVIIQSGDPDHPVIKNVIKSDYHSLFLQQVHERKEFKYPPYYRLVELMVKHKHKNILNTAARQLVEELRHHLKIPVLGPEYPLASRIQLYYQKRILIKINRSQLKENHKEKILEIIHRVKMSQNDKQLQVQINVDPQ